MCRAVTCRTCNKTTWAGCGAHVDQVMAGVPRNQRCPGHDQASTMTEAAATTAAKDGGSLWQRLTGR